MSIESKNWINKVIRITPDTKEDKESIRRLLQHLIENQDTNKTAEYANAQATAKTYIDSEQETPEGLIFALKEMAHLPSGYVGLSIYEAYIGFFRNGELSKLLESSDKSES